MIEILCAQKGIPGRESDAHAAILGFAPGLAHEVTPLGDLLVTVRAAGPGQKTVMLEAHADRIGLVVCGYEEGGFVRVAKAGGLDPGCLMGSEILIEGRDGRALPALVGAPFPYPAKPHNSAPASEYKMPEHSALWVDTGLENPIEHIALGAPAYARARICRLAGSRVAAPCLDDRAGCAALLLAAERLRDEPLGVGVKLLFSSREEIGSHGARTGAFAAAADFAISVDVGFAISPDVTKDDASVLGDGPEIGVSACLDAALTDHILETARRANIPHQTLVLPSRGTGTDADAIAVSGLGVKTGLVSIPLRFMHQPAEVVDLADVEASAALLAAAVKELKP